MDINRLVQNPLKSFDYVISILNATFYRLRYSCFSSKVVIGTNFRARGKVVIRGPGKVIIGNNVYVDGRSCPVTPWTYSDEAEICIGNNVFLNGTRFGCRHRIEIGNDCIIADCQLLDTDFHSVIPGRRNDPQYVKTSPIKIGNNVWLALGCVILRGVTVGDNSTVSARSVVYNDIPKDCVYAGNPAVFINSVPSS